ncbi:MAG TPA: copper resistance protein CopC [Ktedonobacteraceae bacterium]|nr:copper resistance protein CopC [Ktedonobacteraceae bacterium]
MYKSSLPRCLSASVVILLSLGLLFFVTTGTASAHAKVLSATPAIGSTIATAPTTVTVETAENINPDPKLSNLFVYGPSGALISQGNAKVSLNNPREMSIQIKPESTGGVYVVRWITVSAEDNEADEGAFVFTVKSAAAATPTPNATTSATPAPTPTASTTANNSFPYVPVSVAAILALLIGLAAGYGFGRSQASPATSTGSSATGEEAAEKSPDKVK